MICELEGLGISLSSGREWEPKSRGCDLYKLTLLVPSSADEILMAESLCRQMSHAGDDLLLLGPSCWQQPGVWASLHDCQGSVAGACSHLTLCSSGGSVFCVSLLLLSFTSVSVSGEERVGDSRSLSC